MLHTHQFAPRTGSQLVFALVYGVIATAAGGCDFDPSGEGAKKPQPPNEIPQALHSACEFDAPANPKRPVAALLYEQELILVRADGSQFAAHRFSARHPVLYPPSTLQGTITTRSGFVVATIQETDSNYQRHWSYHVLLDPDGNVVWSGETPRVSQPFLSAEGALAASFGVGERETLVRLADGTMTSVGTLLPVGALSSSGELPVWRRSAGTYGYDWVNTKNGISRKFQIDAEDGAYPVELSGRMLYVGRRDETSLLVLAGSDAVRSVELPAGEWTVESSAESGWTLLHRFRPNSAYFRAHPETGALDEIVSAAPAGSDFFGRDISNPPKPAVLTAAGEYCYFLRRNRVATLACTADGFRWRDVGSHFSRVQNAQVVSATQSLLIQAGGYEYSYLSADQEWGVEDDVTTADTLLGSSTQFVRLKDNRTVLLPKEAHFGREPITSDGECALFQMAESRTNASAPVIHTVKAVNIETGRTFELQRSEGARRLLAHEWIKQPIIKAATH